MTPQDEVDDDMDATEEQLAELRRLGVVEKDLEGLTCSDAEEWIDELRSERIDASKLERS